MVAVVWGFNKTPSCWFEAVVGEQGAMIGVVGLEMIWLLGHGAIFFSPLLSIFSGKRLLIRLFFRTCVISLWFFFGGLVLRVNLALRMFETRPADGSSPPAGFLLRSASRRAAAWNGQGWKILRMQYKTRHRHTFSTAAWQLCNCEWRNTNAGIGAQTQGAQGAQDEHQHELRKLTTDANESLFVTNPALVGKLLKNGYFFKITRFLGLRDVFRKKRD